MADATRILDEAIARAPDPQLRARAQVEREIVRLEAGASSVTESLGVVDRVLPVFERDADVRGQCRAWSLRAQAAWITGRVGDADDAWRRAAEDARRSGDEREHFDILGWRATAAVFGPTPVEEAIARCEELRDVVSASPAAVVWTLNSLAVLHAMKGEFELAGGLVDEANATLDQLGTLRSSVSHHEALVRLLAGDHAGAEAPLRAGVQRLTSMSDRALLATTTAMLAQAVFAKGELREADELCRVSADAAAADDIVTQAIWRGVRAKIRARENEGGEAITLARDAVTLLEPTDLLSHHGDALLDLADVLWACGCADEASAAARSGLALYERKGNVAAAARARALMGEHAPLGGG